MACKVQRRRAAVACKVQAKRPSMASTVQLTVYDMKAGPGFMTGACLSAYLFPGSSGAGLSVALASAAC